MGIKNSKKKKVLAYGVLALLAGCATTQAYDGAELPDSQTAILLPNIGHKNSTYVTRAMGVDDKFVGGLFGSPSVKLLPGSHKIKVQCSSSMYSASPFVTHEFRAGHYYELTCRDVGDGRAAAGIVDHGTSNPVLKQ